MNCVFAIFCFLLKNNSLCFSRVLSLTEIFMTYKLEFIIKQEQKEKTLLEKKWKFIHINKT
jgi:hypothetical protein